MSGVGKHDVLFNYVWFEWFEVSMIPVVLFLVLICAIFGFYVFGSDSKFGIVKILTGFRVSISSPALATLQYIHPTSISNITSSHL